MPEVIDLISQLYKLNGSFHRSEQQVADYVLANIDTVAHLTIREIAEQVDVSDATVNRFCRSLGCKGFKDFKINWAQNVAVSLQYMADSYDSGTATERLVSQVFNTLVDTLNIAQRQLIPEDLERAIDLISNCKRIVFIGVGGGSSTVAKEGANRFFRLGIPTESSSDGYYQRMLASTLGKGDLLFAISATGQVRELIDSVNIANQYGASTLSLTTRGSALAQASDLALEVNLPEDQDIFKPSAARLINMAIIDVLAAGVAHRHQDVTKLNLRRIRTSLMWAQTDTGPKPIGD